MVENGALGAGAEAPDVAAETPRTLFLALATRLARIEDQTVGSLARLSRTDSG